MPRTRTNFRNRIYDPTELYEAGDRIFRLRLDSVGRISLELVNAQGSNRSAGHILAINPSGHLQRFGHVNARAGFQRDEQGRVKTYDEEYQEHMDRGAT